jgi:hypothetical protein
MENLMTKLQGFGLSLLLEIASFLIRNVDGSIYIRNAASDLAKELRNAA